MGNQRENNPQCVASTAKNRSVLLLPWCAIASAHPGTYGADAGLTPSPESDQENP